MVGRILLVSDKIDLSVYVRLIQTGPCPFHGLWLNTTPHRYRDVVLKGRELEKRSTDNDDDYLHPSKVIPLTQDERLYWHRGDGISPVYNAK